MSASGAHETAGKAVSRSSWGGIRQLKDHRESDGRGASRDDADGGQRSRDAIQRAQRMRSIAGGFADGAEVPDPAQRTQAQTPCDVLR